MPSFDADTVRRDNPLSEYLPRRGIRLTVNGAEWGGCCPFHAENTPSFTVYRGRKGTQEFHCFGCDAKGDVIDFVQRFDSVGFTEACEILGGTRAEVRRDAAPVPAPAERTDIYAAWVAKLPPASAPQIVAGKRTGPIVNPKRPDRPPPQYTPKSVYPYRLSNGQVIGYVLRVEIRGRKITPLILWCENTETGEVSWCHRPFTGPRRLYNLPAFAERPDAQVLVVEGEKCAEAAKRLLPGVIATCWQGGGKAAGKSDWSPARGREVLIWPDNDPEGVAAAQEVARLCHAAGAQRIRIIEPPGDEQKKGWDIADAEEAGWSRTDVLRFARAGAQDWTAPEAEQPMPVAAAAPPPERPAKRAPRAALKQVTQEKIQAEPDERPDNVVPLRAIQADPTDYEGGVHWRAYLELDGQDRPKPKLMTNYVTFLQRHPMMRGVLTKNAFTAQTIIAKRPAWDRGQGEWRPRKLTDNDVTLAMTWLERAGLTPTHTNTGTAIMAAAEATKIDPIRDYFTGLKWDGQPRLQGINGHAPWLTTYMGVKPTKNEIERAFGMRWMIAAVARNLSERPDGEKVDNMLVLEGEQSRLKSTALEVLATINSERYFTSGISDVTSKDGIMLMQGNIIIEMDELVAISKADTEVVKSFLSRKIDSTRLPYGKTVTDLPRRFVLAGTMNPRGRGYLKDPTGARRFWPVYVSQSTDIPALTRDRDQLWAEAVHLYRAGVPWWLQGDEVEHAATEQRKRFQADAWAGPIDNFLETRVGKYADVVTLSEIFVALSIPTHMQDGSKAERVISHLIANGWIKFTQISGRRRIDAFRRPETNG